MDHIKNLKIVITAGASGIGAEIAKTLSEAGAQVIICDKDQSNLDAFTQNNPKVIAVKADVSNEEEVLSFFIAVKEHFGEINALINNAGIAGPSAKLEDTDLKDWKQTMSVNLNGTLLEAQGICEVRHIVCSLPFVIMQQEQQLSILDVIFKLQPQTQGCVSIVTYFIRCPISKKVLDQYNKSSELFGFTMKNIPPAYVYQIKSGHR